MGRLVILNLSCQGDEMIKRFNPIVQYLQQHISKDWWGTVSIKFQDGIPKIIEEHRTRKLEPMGKDERKS